MKFPLLLLALGISSPLVSAISRIDLRQLPSARTTRADLLRGFSQFQPSLSPGAFVALSSALATLPLPPPASGVKGAIGGGSTFGPLMNAIAAAKLAGTEQTDPQVLGDVQLCLQAILSQGSLPNGFSCVDGADNPISVYGTTFDTILEQFVGIFPPATFTQIQTTASNFFLSLGLIPPANDLFTDLNNALASVVASNSGNAVTAVERLQGCFKEAASGGKINQEKICFAGPNSSLISLNTLFAGVLQQFVGYLPPNVINSIVNVDVYFLSATGAKPGLALAQPLNNAIESIGAAVAGNAVTFVQQIGNCFTAMIMSQDPSSYVCVAGPASPAFTLQVVVNGIIQQAFGYLPPTEVLQLEQTLAPALQSTDPSPSSVATAFHTVFGVSSDGPALVTCIEALEDCVNQAVLGASTTCTLQAKCTPLASA